MFSLENTRDQNHYILLVTERVDRRKEKNEATWSLRLGILNAIRIFVGVVHRSAPHQLVSVNMK
jgi:hypothetical protein